TRQPAAPPKCATFTPVVADPADLTNAATELATASGPSPPLVACLTDHLRPPSPPADRWPLVRPRVGPRPCRSSRGARDEAAELLRYQMLHIMFGQLASLVSTGRGLVTALIDGVIYGMSALVGGMLLDDAGRGLGGIHLGVAVPPYLIPSPT